MFIIFSSKKTGRLAGGQFNGIAQMSGVNVHHVSNIPDLVHINHLVRHNISQVLINHL